MGSPARRDGRRAPRRVSRGRHAARTGPGDLRVHSPADPRRRLSRNCTELADALEQGRFNCVSATVLFNCLAERFGLHVCGLETPGHALSRLILPDGRLDVETTCPRWFQLCTIPGDRPNWSSGPWGGSRPAAVAGAVPRGLRTAIGSHDLLQPRRRPAGRAVIRRRPGRQRQGPAARRGQCHRGRSAGGLEQLGHRAGRRRAIYGRLSTARTRTVVRSGLRGLLDQLYDTCTTNGSNRC